ncbi:MAG: four helix bundle protein [Anaerolineae bacterium]
MEFAEWEQTVSEAMRQDSLWQMAAYRLSLYLYDQSWQDVSKLVRDRRTLSLSDQLCRAVGSIGANLAEGYSRGSGPDRARFYEYALGSAREARDWYYKARGVLGQDVMEQRLQLLTRVIQLLLTMVPQQRGRILREEATAHYDADA